MSIGSNKLHLFGVVPQRNKGKDTCICFLRPMLTNGPIQNGYHCIVPLMGKYRYNLETNGAPLKCSPLFRVRGSETNVHWILTAKKILLRPKKSCSVVLHCPPLIFENWIFFLTVQKYTAPNFQNSSCFYLRILIFLEIFLSCCCCHLTYISELV